MDAGPLRRRRRDWRTYLYRRTATSRKHEPRDDNAYYHGHTPPDAAIVIMRKAAARAPGTASEAAVVPCRSCEPGGSTGLTIAENRHFKHHAESGSNPRRASGSAYSGRRRPTSAPPREFYRF